VFLHVGLPKSGTSFVQRILVANRGRLKSSGLLFPGRRWHQQVMAVRDVRTMGRRRGTGGAWERLVQEIAAWPDDSVISMEWLCAAPADVVRRIVDDLAPARVEVVFTARDLGRTLPAAWQEGLQNRYEWTWEEFLEGVAAEDRSTTSAGQAFWSQQDLAGLLERWTDAVPADQVHVVTVPGPGAPPDLLWRRVAQVLGVAVDDCVIGGMGVNESLGLESAELMRRLNPLTREAGLSRVRYQQLFKHRLAKRTLAKRRDAESRLALPGGRHGWVRETAARQVAAVRSSGVDVVGDLAELEPVLREGRQPADVPDGPVLDAALAGLVALGVELEAARRREAALESRVARLERRLERTSKRAKRASERARALGRRVRAYEAAPVRSAARLRLGPLRRRMRFGRT